MMTVFNEWLPIVALVWPHKCEVHWHGWCYCILNPNGGSFRSKMNFKI